MSPSTPSLPSVAADEALIGGAAGGGMSDAVLVTTPTTLPHITLPKHGNYTIWIDKPHTVVNMTEPCEMCCIEAKDGEVVSITPITQEQYDRQLAVVMSRSHKPARARETTELEEPDNTVLNYIQTHKAADHKQIAKDLKLSIRTVKKALNRLRIHGHVNRTKTRS